MKNTHKKITAFTLIELLVVIVIIGILATISTNLFSGQSSKALVAKYQAERLQAAKERHSECIAFDHSSACSSSFMVYQERYVPGDAYKQGVSQNSSSSPSFFLDLGANFTYLAVSHDGKYIYYPHTGFGDRIYRKEINDVGATPEEVNQVASAGLTLTLDGEYLIYTNTTDGLLYKKEIGTSANDPGDVFTNHSGDVPVISQDNKFVFYIHSGDVYKKSLSSGPGSLGELVLSGTLSPVPNRIDISMDNDYLFYSYDVFVYKKLIGSDPSDPGEVLVDTIADNTLAIVEMPGEDKFLYDGSGSGVGWRVNVDGSGSPEVFLARGFHSIAIFP